MARAITNLARVSLIAEVTAGTTPTTPAMQILRTTSENFNVGALFTKSEEFNPAAQTVDQILVAKRAEGGFGFEWADGEAGIEKMLESALWGAWATDNLVSGITGVPLSIEVKYEAGATDQHKLFTGMYGNELSLDFKAGEKIRGNCSFVGMTSLYQATGFASATYTAIGTEPVDVSSTLVLSSTGLTVSAVTSLSIKLNNNARLHNILGSYTPSAVQKGTTELSGDIELYMNTGTVDWATNFLANTSFTISAVVGTTAGKKNTFLVPRAKFKTLTVVAEGNDQDVMVKGTWEGFYDSATGGHFKITRNV